MYCSRGMLSVCSRWCIKLDTQHDPLISQYRVCHLGDCGKSLAESKYAYELPENVSEVYELYLQDVDWSKKHRRRQRLKKEQYRALRSLILDQDVQWNVLFDLFQNYSVSLNDLLMGEDFFKCSNRVLSHKI